MGSLWCLRTQLNILIETVIGQPAQHLPKEVGKVFEALHRLITTSYLLHIHDPEACEAIDGAESSNDDDDDGGHGEGVLWGRPVGKSLRQEGARAGVMHGAKDGAYLRWEYRGKGKGKGRNCRGRKGDGDRCGTSSGKNGSWPGSQAKGTARGRSNAHQFW